MSVLSDWKLCQRGHELNNALLTPPRHSNPTLEDAAEKLASKMQDKAVSCGFLLTSYGIRYALALYNQ